MLANVADVGPTLTRRWSGCMVRGAETNKEVINSEYQGWGLDPVFWGSGCQPSQQRKTLRYFCLSVVNPVCSGRFLGESRSC